LLVHLHPYCFSYAVIDRDLNKVVSFEAKVLAQTPGKFLQLDSIAIWFKLHSEVFSLPYKTSKVAVYSPEFTVLPDKTEKAKEVFQLLGYSDNDAITYLKNKIGHAFYTYYSLPDKTINFIENHLLNTEF
jgi:hypothetical protein